jgi:hypothetical protein
MTYSKRLSSEPPVPGLRDIDNSYQTESSTYGVGAVVVANFRVLRRTLAIGGVKDHHRGVSGNSYQTGSGASGVGAAVVVK